MKVYNLYFNGQLTPASDGKVFDAINPSNGEVFAKVASASLIDMQSAINSAREQFDNGEWSKLSVQQRGEYLKKISQLIRDNAFELARLECADVGKTIKHANLIDVPTAAETFDFFAGVEKWLSSKELDIPAPVRSLIEREPIGVIAAVIPWNYPMIMTAWKMAPALIAGNTVVFKPSSKACASVMRLAELIETIGLPKGVINIVPSADHQTASELVSNPMVDKISFTGGTETGRQVMQMASINIKRMTLELGGKSPNIVFADSDIDAAVGGAMSAIFMNQGQMCTSGSRLLLDEKIYDVFMAKLVEKTKALRIGIAEDYATDFGPLVTCEHRDSVYKFIQKGVSEGAKILCGGKIPTGADFDKGFYLEPTILGDVRNDMFVAQEEAFGPVLCVISFSSEEEAVKLANDTKYGLAASVWTKDEEKAKRIARQIKCGTVWVNTYGGFYNEAPFGGYKQSGFGRELGMDGLYEYTQTKHICIDKTPGGTPLVSGWF
ncbi:MAG: aldehyde dehydrogenase family protein [Candidatus Omnitrophica bacterium]|nr:aldehyde dehydrogenase family protein [Candidatus Omnitrophota bacterium]